jgi:hypothetical protein
MATAVRARFNGKVFVPEEPVDLPVGTHGIFFAALEPEHAQSYWEHTREDALQALQRLVQRGVHGACIPDQSLRRENLYEERGP